MGLLTQGDRDLARRWLTLSVLRRPAAEQAPGPAAPKGITPEVESQP
jgi:hypothetical protein